MQVELKSCPFCGGDAMDFYRRNTGATADWCGPVDHWVSCTGDCGAATCMHGTKDEAIAAWNRRAEVVGEIVAWLREQDNGYIESAGYTHAAEQIEAKFGGRDAPD